MVSHCLLTLIFSAQELKTQMKHKLFTLFILLLLGQAVNAQDYHLGLRMGYSNSAINSENEAQPSISSRQAFNFGLVHTYRALEAPIGFSVETGYLLKGTRVNSGAIDYRMHFLSMPVLLDLYPNKRLRMSIGPEINYLLDGRNHLTDSTSITLHNIYTNRWEVAGVVSASYIIDFFMEVGARYSQGLNTLANRDAILGRNRIRTTSFQIFFYFKVAN